MLISASALQSTFGPNSWPVQSHSPWCKESGHPCQAKLISNPGSVTSWLYDLGALLKLKRVYFFTHKIVTVRKPTDIDDISEMKVIVLSDQ